MFVNIATLPRNDGCGYCGIRTCSFGGPPFKGKGKGLITCYSAVYMSQTCDQQCFTISEVAADWHEPVVPQRIVWLSIARTNGQLDPRGS